MDFLREAPSKTVIERLDPLCNNYIDIYTGELLPAEICQAVINNLKTTNALEKGSERIDSRKDSMRRLVSREV